MIDDCNIEPFKCPGTSPLLEREWGSQYHGSIQEDLVESLMFYLTM